MPKTFLKAEYNNGSMMERGNNWLETRYRLNTDRILTTMVIDEKDGEQRAKRSRRKLTSTRYKKILHFLRTDFLSADDNDEWDDSNFWEISFTDPDTGKSHSFRGVIAPEDQLFSDLIQRLLPFKEKAVLAGVRAIAEAVNHIQSNRSS